jgi:hypothetical protein
MTQYYRLSPETLAVWTHMGDPSVDDPANTLDVSDRITINGEHPKQAEALLEQWLLEQSVPQDIRFQDAIRVLVDLRANCKPCNLVITRD